MDYIIPKKIVTYDEGKNPPDEQDIRNSDNTFYYRNKDEKIEVIYWVRYPAYDMIFGIPVKGENKKYKKEVGFFQFRDTNAKKIREGFYLDVVEVLELVRGFARMVDISKDNSPELWKKYYEKYRTSK